ncbi:multiple sugar transport system substrate-binding protein [Spinactinospora alkalitolerans]|uniref:Multiple sugar transport system substrate-binding protein n=1 Tax=Spinactinospora alkalitolerans TaxID=687207 RepID=A0A852TY21_9ACTN|nr:extracellular solute-binding protein [Spinactinospora alkalitolerans]NYE46750.1 multiple sugar transport system substrate-binding protein [Spinactinospora alkalitolerans]
MARRARSRTYGLTAVALAAGLVAAGCGGGSGSGNVELRYSWWGNADRAELMQQAIDLFEEQNPGITVTPTFSEYDSYWEKLSTQTAGGGMPDVLQMDFSYLREYADRGVLLDLNEQTGENLDTGDLLENFQTAGEIDGARYAVPIGGNVFALFHDPAAFEEAGAPAPEPGWSWEDYDEAVRAVTGSTGADPYGGSDYTNLIWVFELQLRQEGGQLFTEDGELGFDEQRLAEFWEQGESLREDDQVVPASKAVQALPVSPLGADLAASEFSWDNFLARFAEEAEAEVELSPVPTSDPDRLGQYLKPSLMLSASAGTEYRAEAATLIDFMINDPEVAEIFGGSRGIPATTTQREAAEFSGVDAAIAAYEDELLDDLQEMPPAPPAGAGALEAEFIRISEEVGFDRMTPEAAAAEFSAFAERTLNP